MEIILHPGQSRVFEDLFINQDRYVTIAASRGWGKSFFASICAINAVRELLELDPSVPNKNVFIVATTLDQVKDIYIPILNYEFQFDSWCTKVIKDRGIFELQNHVTLRLLSYEAIDRMRGKGCYFNINDEMASWGRAREAWRTIIKPTITTRWSEQHAKRFNSNPGKSLTISTPRGYNFFYDHWSTSDKNYQFDYTQSPYLDQEEIEKEKELMDPVEWASEYEAKFKESGLSVFYTFSKSEHVTEVEPETDNVIVGIDFNVAVMATVIGKKVGNRIEWFDEIKGFPDTETLAQELVDRYKTIEAFPDPTGNARKTSAPVGTTDFTILRDYGIKVYARTKSPTLVDSVKAVNRLLYQNRMVFSPKMRNTIMSVERTVWMQNDNASIDKSEGIEHFSDAVRYPCEYLYPVKNTGSRSARGFGF